MSITKGLLNRMNEWQVRRFACRPMECRPERPQVSFTFDDFPRTAWQNGGEILARHGAHGTYYVAVGLVGQTTSGGPLCTHEDIRAVVDASHELGCHTFSHEICQEVSARAFEESLQRNRDAIHKLLPDCAWQSFSYPFGSATVAAKRMIGKRFLCGRGIRPGTHRGRIDANYLRANSLYSARQPLEERLNLIQRNALERGWLIFYTHDVCDAPSRFGCTPEYFAAVVQGAAESGSEIVTVAEAMERLNDSRM